MADVALSLDVSKADTARFATLISRAQSELGKSPFDAVNWAGYFITRSMAAATKVSPKLRKIVKNPRARAFDQKGGPKRDNRMAMYGVNKYDHSGVEYFVPIFRTGEFGKIRFVDKKTAEWLVWDKITGKITKAQWETGTGEFQIAGIAQSKKRKIARSGLAKQAWKWAQSNTRKGGSATIDGAKNAMQIKWSGKRFNPTMTLENHLRYASDAFKTGEAGVENVMAKAGSQLANRIDAALGKVRTPDPLPTPHKR